MGSIRSGVGLISGLNSSQIVDSLISLQRAPVVRLENRLAGIQSKQTGLKTLEANIVSITTSIQNLGNEANFNAFTVANSDKTQVGVTASTSASAGTYRYQAVREAATHSVLSKGFANADQQSIGTGTLVIAAGGRLDEPTLLDALNSGNGVRRGSIRITDRSGSQADIDLSSAYTVEDVLEAINASEGISVAATARGDHIEIADTSGSTASNLTVVDLNGGHTAEDLGIEKSVASSTLSGDAVYSITGDFTLDQINDGNGLRLLNGGPDIRITLSDDSVIEVNLDGAATLDGIIDKINNHEDNEKDGGGQKVTAALVDGQLVLTDDTGGGGAGNFTVEDINDTAVVRQLGLDTTAAGDTLTGRKLAAGMNSVLLANLQGGTGIDVVGSISLTDRAGETATIDLSGAESLDEVLAAINAAVSDLDSDKLQLTARINDLGTGIEIVDTSGSTASDLIIADVGGSTLAAQLGIAVSAAQNSVDSGSLNLRYVNQATSISNYAPDGGAISAGSIRITDSDGNEAVVEISSAVKNIGDVIQRINAASGVAIRAELNETGDGFVLIDEGSGSEPPRVEEEGGITAADLRLLGDAVLGGDGAYRISSRLAAVVEVEADDTLDDIVEKINSSAGFVKASVFDDGSAFNSFRLALDATSSGRGGRFIVDSGGLNLGLNTITQGDDALLRVGGSVASGFLIASPTNTFANASTGIDVDVLQPSATAADVTVTRDTKKIQDTLKSFTDNFNKFVSAAKELTKFDAEANTRGVLQGQGVVLRIQSRLDGLITKQFGDSDSSIRSLTDLGIRLEGDGKLSFNADRLSEALNADFDAVLEFFQAEEGFASHSESVIESLTDPFTGTFALENTSLQNSVDSLSGRIEDLDAILQVRRERLLLEFTNMESILGSLQTQQQAILGIGPIAGSSISLGI